MNPRIIAQAAFFLSLAMLGTNRVSVPSPSLFTGLHPCDVPGLRERVVSRTAKTIAFAGEFRPTRSTPWVWGKHRIYLYVVSGAGSVRMGKMSEHIYPGDFVVLPGGAYRAIRATTPVMRAIYVEET